MSSNETVEVNFDGLIGPSHNYGGMSDGNLASQSNAGDVSNPREAAIQGLEKMRLLVKAGFVQGVLPPLDRPDFRFLDDAGFTGSDADVIEAAAQRAPKLLKAAYSASSMWTAKRRHDFAVCRYGRWNACISAPRTCPRCCTDRSSIRKLSRLWLQSLTMSIILRFTRRFLCMPTFQMKGPRTMSA